jgi:hypothetical protein
MLIDLAAENRKLQYHYQPHTVKTRQVLSLIFPGLQVIEHQPDLITATELNRTLTYAKGNEENSYVYN